DLITLQDLTNEEILGIFNLADEYLASRDRIQGRLSSARDFILASLFYEPSTRTRFSFESAMNRLGGHVIASADPRSTSTAKGETLTDTMRVLQTYADIIVIRHPC